MVKYEKNGKIAFITLNRPEVLNAIDIATTEELARIWCDFRDDDTVWIAILKGEGKSFCAGADVGKMDLEKKWNITQSLIFGNKRMGPNDYKIWKPIIAALNGYVLGAGLYLALQCDLRIATEDVELGLPEPQIGIPTLFTPFLRDYFCPIHAMELLLIGDRINAKRAYQMGLLNWIVPQDKLLDFSKSIAERMSQNGPLTLRAMKEAFHLGRNMDFNSSLTLIEKIFTPIMNSEDAAEGRRAFREKRKPQWKCK